MLKNLFGKKPGSHAVRITPANKEFRVERKQTLLQAALSQGIPFPHDCRAGGCATCKCRLVKGKVRELTDKSYLLSAEELRDNYVLACQSVPQGDVEVEVQLWETEALASAAQSAARITRIAPLTHDIVHLELEFEHALAFTPGQYCELAAKDGSAAGVKRSYSFANLPEASGASLRAEFFIRKVPGGRFTEWLFNEAQPGDMLDATAPYGDFVLRESRAPMLCIAGGSGLAPVLSLLRGALLSLRQPREVTLVFGARRQEDLYMLDAVEALRREWPVRFDFVPVLADEPVGSNWRGRQGLIGDHLLELLGSTAAAQQTYLCGPPGMIDSCTAVLRNAGAGQAGIYFDKFLDQSHLAPAGKAA